MKLKELSIFDESLVYTLAYEEDSNFCTEAFEKNSEWYNRILSEYGETEVTKVRVEQQISPTVLFYVGKETCFKVSREIMNRFMSEDDSWKEIA